MRRSRFRRRRLIRSFAPTVLGLLLFIGGGVAARANGLPSNTPITSTPVGTISVDSVTLTFTSDPAGASFACALHGAPPSTCASRWTPAALADGSRTFKVPAAA